MCEIRTIEEMAAAGMARIQEEQLAVLEIIRAGDEATRIARVADWMAALEVVRTVIPAEMWPDLHNPDFGYFPQGIASFTWEKKGYAPISISVWRERDLARESKEHVAPLWSPWQAEKHTFDVPEAFEGSRFDYDPGYREGIASTGDLEKALGYAKIQAVNLELYWVAYNAEKAAAKDAQKEVTYEPVDEVQITDLANELGELIIKIVREEIARVAI